MEKEIDGFIYKGHAFDLNDQIQLKFFGLSDSKDFEIKISNFTPYFFVETKDPIGPDIFKTPFGTYAKKTYYKSLEERKKLKAQYEQQKTRTFEIDIRPVDQFLMDKRIYGKVKFNPSKPDQISASDSAYYPHFSVVSFDIETAKDGRLLSIAVHSKKRIGFSDSSDETKVFMLGSGESESILFCPTEILLIKSFEKYILDFNPDIIIGWNVIGFDFKFIIERAKDLKIKFNLSRDQQNMQFFQNKRGDWNIDIPGRVVIDGPWALKMNFFSFESFKLGEVAKEILGDQKDIDEDEVFDKWGEIERRFNEDKEALARYNLKDAELVTGIFEKTNLIDLLINRSMISGMLLEKVGGSTAAFDHFFLPEFHDHGYVATNVLDIEWEREAKGGFVLDPISGIHQDVIVLDFKSLYPTVIRTFLIDPLSRIESKMDPVVTPVGISFSKSMHILPNKISSLLDLRAKAKKDKNENLSMAIKILMNSFYGVMGSSGCRFYHSDLPDAITGSGQWILKTTILFLENSGYQILYGDTDSIFVKLNNDHEVFEQGAILVKKVNEYLTDKIAQDFKTDSHLEIQFDKYFKTLILTKMRGQESGAKKRYAGLRQKIVNGKVVDEMVLTGMEYVRSDWSLLARRFQYEVVRRIFYLEDIENYISSVINDLEKGKFNDELILSKRISKPIEEYVKNIPPHVRSLILLYEKLGIRKKKAEFIMTKRGPIPKELPHDDIDFDYYIDKQLIPVVEGIIGLIDINIEQFRNKQLSLF
jgi:DNA polymerase-2